ncbi:MAG: hypothetical protein GXY67_14195 [Clostridiales bacterium]|nr:hypothetical protein [Clostridiales bacterium]
MANLHLNFRSDCLSRSVYPVVFLPDYTGWNERKPPYPTLYFLPGYSGGGLETATFTNFSLFSMVYGIAIVMVDGENSFYVDDEARGALFSQYVGREIVEVTRELLPLSRERDETFIGGISMGGYGALVNGLRFPRTFGKIAMLSPALELTNRDDQPTPGCPVPHGELLATLGRWKQYEGTYKDVRHATQKALEDPASMPELFLTWGRQDGLVGESCRRYASELREAGAPLALYEAEGGHDHAFWKRALTPCCQFLTGKGGEAACISG